MGRKGRKKKDTNFHPESVGDYPVGYGVTPPDKRFKSGVSGNRKGRPKGSKNVKLHSGESLASMILGEGHQTIDVKEGDTQKRMAAAKAVLRRMKIDAVKGNFRSQKEFVNLMLSVEREERSNCEGLIKAVMDYKVGWYSELQQRKAAGIATPPLPPHPDDIHIDPRTGAVTVRGPLTPEEEVVLEELMAIEKAAEYEISEISKLMINEPDYPYRDQLPAAHAHALKLIKIVRRTLGAPWTEEYSDDLLSKKSGTAKR